MNFARVQEANLKSTDWSTDEKLVGVTARENMRFFCIVIRTDYPGRNGGCSDTDWRRSRAEFRHY